MVGGDDYNELPFNLATQGQRQPGSAIKPFILAEALDQGISANSTWTSNKLEIDVPKSTEVFTVNNYENAYSGITTLARATTFSDNAVFAQVGIKVGTRNVARLAERMGIRTNVSTNYAMTLGGLEQGVTPLDMAHAYETFASGGELVYGSLSPGADNSRREVSPGPVGIERINRDEDDGADTEWEPVTLPNGERAVNRKRTRRILDEGVAEQVHSLLQGVVQEGTGTRAQVGDEVIAGKTGTTEGYGDAWFVGWNEKYTIAVWVGYPDEFKAMETEFQGQPVAGGTYPAGIFKTFMESLLTLDPSEEDEEEDTTTPEAGTVPETTAPVPEATVAPETEEAAPPVEEEQATPPPAEQEEAAPPAVEEETAPPPAEQEEAPPPGAAGGESAPPP
jgi:penicillin-binding protein 1A